MRAYERFVQYVQVHTASAEDLSKTPTTERQFDLSRLLAREMESLGMEGVYVEIDKTGLTKAEAKQGELTIRDFQGIFPS